MARNAMTTSTMIMLLVTFLVLFSEFGIGEAQPKQRTLNFTYYLHDNFVPPGITATQTIALNGNFSAGMTEFGDQSAFNSLLKVGAARNSTLIGHHSGITSLMNQPNLFHIILTAQVDPPFAYTGFFTLQGRFNSSNPTWDLVVTGGTGSFLGAGGVAHVTVIDPDFVLGLIIRYDFELLFWG